jgi:hypothetical protein
MKPMRIASLWAVFVALLCAGSVVPDTANAHESKLHRKVQKKHVKIVHLPARPAHYVEVRDEDPYAWHYSPRGYYPYYASHYWVPTKVVRARHRTDYRCVPGHDCYAYRPAWGYPRKHWQSGPWHWEHHGRHHIRHW